MKVLFYQPNHTGHHFAYLARMLPGFIGLPIDIVVATTPDATLSDEYARTLAPLSHSITILKCCTPPPRRPLANARHRLRELVRAIRDIQPDHVFVCYADGIWDLASAATLIGRRPWPRELVVEGAVYRGRFGDLADRRWRAIARRWLFKRLLRLGLFHKLHAHHEMLYEFVYQAARELPTTIVLAPDPIALSPPIDAGEARRRLGIPEEGRCILLSGMIARYKGANLLLDAYRIYATQTNGPPARLVLAGPHEEEIRAMMRRPPYASWVEQGRIVSLDRFLNEEEMYTSAAASDLVTAPYPRHQGRSSVILWAAAAGRPSLGTNASCVGHVIRKQQLGGTCDVENSAAFAKALETRLKTRWTEEDANRVRRYAEFHRIENYQEISTQLIRERLAR